MDGVAAVDKVVDIVEGIEVSDCGHTMLLEEFSMELDHISWLGIETDDVDTTSQGLKICIRTSDSSELVHHVECIFVCVEVKGLESSSATCFEVCDTCFSCCCNCRHEVFCEYSCSVYGLETVTECCAHESNLFLAAHNTLPCLVNCSCNSCCDLCVVILDGSHWSRRHLFLRFFRFCKLS